MCPYPSHLPEKKPEGVNLIQDEAADEKKPRNREAFF
jgi:hypothetical protein